MIRSAGVLTILFVFATTTDASNLRRREDRRKLQLAPLVNGLIQGLTPMMDEWITTELAEHDSVVVGTEKQKELEEVDEDGLCHTTATVTYGLSRVQGVSNIKIHDIEMVDGTDYMDISFWGLNGATWGGDWKFNGTFPSLTIETTVGLNMSICGIPVLQNLTGVLNITDSNLAGVVGFDGQTNNLFRLFSGDELFTIDSSTEVSPLAKEVSVGVGSVSANFGVEGTVVELASTQKIEKAVVDTFASDVQPFIKDLVNKLLVEQSPMAIYNTKEQV